MFLQASWNKQRREKKQKHKEKGDPMPAKEVALITICWLHMRRLAENLVPFMGHDIKHAAADVIKYTYICS